MKLFRCFQEANFGPVAEDVSLGCMELLDCAWEEAGREKEGPTDAQSTCWGCKPLEDAGTYVEGSSEKPCNIWSSDWMEDADSAGMEDPGPPGPNGSPALRESTCDDGVAKISAHSSGTKEGGTVPPFRFATLFATFLHLDFLWLETY
jgi:hypothetical protein